MNNREVGFWSADFPKEFLLSSVPWALVVQPHEPNIKFRRERERGVIRATAIELLIQLLRQFSEEQHRKHAPAHSQV